MPAVITEQPLRMGVYIVGEEPDSRSREVGVVTGGADLPAGTVLGKVTASGKYAILAPAASDGSQTAAAILYQEAPVSAGDVRRTIHVRDCSVNGLVLTWPGGITTNQQNTAIAQLATLGVIVRT